MVRFQFPSGFFWGSGTSAFQVEGNPPPSNWTRAAEEGYVPAIGLAADHYRRFREDFDIAQGLGQNAHRFSIEWGRIEPAEGEFDQREAEHYREVIRALRERGIEPFVTLWHFTIPLWLEEQGGAACPDFPKHFEAYCRFVVEQLGGDVHYWMPLNEPLPFANNGWLRGSWPPFRKWWLVDIFGGFGYPAKGDRPRRRGTFLSYLRVRRHLAEANNRAYRAIKKVSPNAQVGISKHTLYYHAHGWNPFYHVLAWGMNQFWTHSFMRRIARSCDFIGVNQYFDREFGRVARYQKTDIGWEIYPPALFGALILLKRYQKPMYITENGIADRDDVYRADFIRDNIREVHRAIEDGLDIRGYFYWSLLDNYELAEGYTMRFGLVEVDFHTQERTIRPSAQVYKKICEANALESNESEGNR